MGRAGSAAGRWLAADRDLAPPGHDARRSCGSLAALLVLTAIAFGLVARHAAASAAKAVQRSARPRRCSSRPSTCRSRCRTRMRSRPRLPAGRDRTAAVTPPLQGGAGAVGRRRAEIARAIGASPGRGPAVRGSRGRADVRRADRERPVHARQGYPVGNAYLREAPVVRNVMLPSARELYEIRSAEPHPRLPGWSVGRAAARGRARRLHLLAALSVDAAVSRPRDAAHRQPGPWRWRRVLLPASRSGSGWLHGAARRPRRRAADRLRSGELLTVTRIPRLARTGRREHRARGARRRRGRDAPAGRRPRLSDRDPSHPRTAHARRRRLRTVRHVRSTRPISATSRRISRSSSRSSAATSLPRCSSRWSAARTAGRRPMRRARPLNGALDREVSRAQERFLAESARAGGASTGCLTPSPRSALSLLLALFGVRQRLEEYR